MSLIAILGVSLTTLLLIQLHFQQSEQRFLHDQIGLLFQPLTQALQNEVSAADLQNMVTLLAYERRLRIQLFDLQGNLLADSGPFNQLPPLAQLPLPNILNPSPILPAPNPSTSLPVINAVSEQTLTAPLLVNNQFVAQLELSEGPAIGQPTIDSIRLAIIGSGLIALTLAALVGFLSAQQIAISLSRLREAASQMAAGDLATHAPASGLTEFDQLGEQLNRMARQLSRTIAALEGEQAVLRRLIGDASHELRTPLTALKTFNELLQHERLAEQEPAGTFIRESAGQLTQLDRLTSGLLDLSRLEARLRGADLALADIRTPIIEAVNGLRPLAQAKNQTLDLAVPRTAIQLAHDSPAIQQAISNLVNNAIKYAPAGASIKVDLAYEKGQAIIIVSDNGPGIPAGEQPLVFKRFYRGQNQASEGSGLGLAICQEIAAIHNGQIHFSSQEGRGTTFTLTLPGPDKLFTS